MTDYSPVPQSPFLFSDLETETSFRVLELHPGRNDAPISCSIHLADWTQPPEYEAVSYAWGDPNLKAVIKCDGKRLEVGRNIHTGLAHLRSPNRPRTLWVDCIWSVTVSWFIEAEVFFSWVHELQAALQE
jgi:hypothetical protein